MWWGYSPALDIQLELNKSECNCLGLDERLEVLIVGAGDARHIVKTLASSYLHHDRIITYNVIESTLEQVARSILLLSTCLDKNLGLQEATRYYLEIFGNTLVRPATAKYLIKHSNHLANIPTCTVDCPWLSLETFKHKDKDRLEAIFKFWERAACENIPIVEHWNQRVRKSLKTRYDYRDGVFDWDYHMILKSRNILNLTLQEYRFWRSNGVAFTWLEGEPVRSNPTLLSNIIQYGPASVHCGYLGDITNGPFYAWTLEEGKHNEYRATDAAEQEVMRSIHEIKTREPLCDDVIGSHRDSSILNGTLVTEMPNNQIEQEIWKRETNKSKNDSVSWINIENHKVIFHPIKSIQTLKYKVGYMNRFDYIWIAHNMTEHLPNFIPLLKKGAIVLIELKKNLVELREEDLFNFVKELKSCAQKNGLREIGDINVKKHCIAKFCKT
ncbi:PREDICTED: dynein assembly factor 3, axonemal [Dufourea novaeangliae]|uniref:dynein assembly factor 3, axonemal n=1 Tax=Dufourea novaeangliae TaxID=178035 RepID=UPI000767437E|nr:PREDICTED: dynein assembly factor 3, axonemal [Dufourea novaeangliae]